MHAFSTHPRRFGYASVTILPQWLRLCSAVGARGFQRRFYYDPTTTMKIRLRLVYAAGDAVATLPRHRRWSYAFVVILIPFNKKSTVELVYVQLNVNFQIYDYNCCSGYASADKHEHRLIILDDKVQARRRRWGWV